MRTVTVLGAAGFLGSAIADALSAREIDLRLVARRPVTLPPDAVANVTTHLVDVTDEAALMPVLDGSDVIMYLLKHSGDWRTPDAEPGAELVNVGAMRTIVKTFAGTENPPVVVYAGGIGQVGPPPEGKMDGSEPDHPNSEYDRQKLAAERVMIAGHDEGAVRGISLRLPTVFGQRPAGPRDPGVVVTMAHKALAGEPLTMWGDGAITRDLVHIDDCVAAFLAAADNPADLAGRHWIVGTGEVWTLARLFRAIAASVGEHTGTQPVPVVSVPPPAHSVAADAHSVLLDPEPFRRASGWVPGVSPEEGIDRTVAVLVGEKAENLGMEQRV
jgi:nucleoside-diphosphate-sugar epimerase